MKVPQYPYLSPEACELRRRDRIPPWGIHVCEVDSFDESEDYGPGFAVELAEARALRRALEAEPD